MSASPSLPAALTLGATEKAIDDDAIESGATDDSFNKAEIPGLGDNFIEFIPRITIDLVSPVSETTSAIDAIAARSEKLSDTALSSPSRAQHSLNATPAPHSSVFELLSSFLCGSTTASASGRFSPGSW